MRTHVSDESLVELLDGAAGAPVEEHLRSCGPCRERLESARAGLALARQADVPEPSPSYWEGFRRQVGRRLDEGRRPWHRSSWPALAALAAGLGVLFVVLPERPVQPPPGPAAMLPAWSALPAAEDDHGLAILQAVAAQLEPEAECPRLEDCVTALSDEEIEALAEMLRGEAPGRAS